MKDSIAIVGAGYMGGGMAQVFAMAGHVCALADIDFPTASRGRDRLLAEAQIFEADGLFAEGSTEQIAENLRAAASIEDAIESAVYVAEVVPENRKIKADVLSRISRHAAVEAMIGSNTSAIPITELGAFVTNPGRFLGVHWMNPAPFVPCVELVPLAETRDDVTDAVEELISGLGKATSRVSDSSGFVANRLQFALFREAALLAEEGIATTDEIDRIVSNSFGFRLPFFGPFGIADMAGLDVYSGAYESLETAFGERFSMPSSLRNRVDAGKLGVKSGQGFRNYNDDEVLHLTRYRNRAYVALQSLRSELGPPPRLGVAAQVDLEL